MSKFVTAARKFESEISKRISNTVVELATDVIDALCEEWEEMDLVTALAEAKKVTEGSGDNSKSVASRTTEWKDFVFAAIECNLKGALRKAKTSGDFKLTRQSMFQLAKKLRGADSVESAMAACSAGGKNDGKEKTPEQKFGMGIGIIKNAETKSRKLIAFRKALAELCAEHGIAY